VSVETAAGEKETTMMVPRALSSLAFVIWMCLACSGTGSSMASGLADVAAQGLMNQVGGMDSMASLARNFLSYSAEDPRLTSVMGDTLADSGGRDAMQLRLSDQLCSMLGGGCEPAVTDEQIAAGASRLTPEQSAAVNDNLGRSLSELNLSSTVKDAVTKAIAPKLPGVFGALL
jgi:hypothetical protein